MNKLLLVVAGVGLYLVIALIVYAIFLTVRVRAKGMLEPGEIRDIAEISFMWPFSIPLGILIYIVVGIAELVLHILKIYNEHKEYKQWKEGEEKNG